MKYNDDRVVDVASQTSSSSSSAHSGNDESDSSSEALPDIQDLFLDEGHDDFEETKSKFCQQFEYSAIKNLNVDQSIKDEFIRLFHKRREKAQLSRHGHSDLKSQSQKRQPKDKSSGQARQE